MRLCTLNIFPHAFLFFNVDDKLGPSIRDIKLEACGRSADEGIAIMKQCTVENAGLFHGNLMIYLLDKLVCLGLGSVWRK